MFEGFFDGDKETEGQWFGLFWFDLKQESFGLA
jgi:hypothetical protein